nr:hypothetical protein [Tanacetum cinerariifolium]
MMGDVSDQKVPIPGLTITRILNQEKSPDLLSHLGCKAFQPSAECPMIINGKNIPVLDVPLFHFTPLDQLNEKKSGLKKSKRLKLKPGSFPFATMMTMTRKSLSDEDVPKKIYSNPLFEEEIIPIEIDQHSFNAESDLIESVPNHDSSITISSKIDSLFDEFARELTLLKSIPLGIDETDCHPEKEIRLTKRLLYDNSSPRLPKEIVSDNSNADIESFSPSPIPVEDSDSHMEEIDLYFNSDDPMPLGIEEYDDDSERDILILEELLDNYSLSLPNNESYHFDIPLIK